MNVIKYLITCLNLIMYSTLFFLLVFTIICTTIKILYNMQLLFRSNVASLFNILKI